MVNQVCCKDAGVVPADREVWGDAAFVDYGDSRRDWREDKSRKTAAQLPCGVGSVWSVTHISMHASVLSVHQITCPVFPCTAEYHHLPCFAALFAHLFDGFRIAVIRAFGSCLDGTVCILSDKAKESH
jgi:hypothetical protein